MHQAVLKVAVNPAAHNPVAPKAVQPVVLSPVDPLQVRKAARQLVVLVDPVALKAAKVVKAAKVARHRMQALAVHPKTGAAQWAKPVVDRAPKPLMGLQV